jgi:hypothetical protein
VKGFGVLLLALGIGSFILPAMGMQFKLVSIFGQYQGIAGGVMAAVGALLLVAGFLMDKKGGGAEKKDEKKA